MASVTTSPPDIDATLAVTASAPPRVRLEFLDGLRGIAAVYVVLFHAVYFAQGMKMSFVAHSLVRVFQLGHYAVDVFIVLSGYCLMIPVARAADKQIPRGVLDYIKRRARRILPPYYVALLLSLLLVVAAQFFSHLGRLHGKVIPEVLTPGILLSHLLLIHNLSLAWVFRINGPLWSVATEWQIYFIFPCLLLPLWRRTGEFTTVIVGFLIGSLPILLLPQKNNLWWASPWFIGLFAMGMASASANFSRAASAARWRKILLAPFVQIPVFIGFLALNSSHSLLSSMILRDFLLGLAVSGFITYCSQAAMDSHQNNRPFVLRFLESPLAVKLGAFSYSLYLIHYPLLQAGLRLLQMRFHHVESVLFLQVAIGVPLIIAAAYLFHLLFERPFLSTARQKAS